MAPQYSYAPQYDVAGTGTYQQSLQRWLQQQERARKQFTAAEEPLRESVQMFQPGGGYGAGQFALLEDEARRARALATTEQVASGMSSGSLASSTAMRSASDLAKAKLGVEDTRTQFLNQALQALSGLRGGQAQTTATVTDPTYAPYMGYIAARHGQVAGLSQQSMQSESQLASAAMQTSAQLRMQQMRNELELTLARLGNKSRPTPSFL